MLGIGGSTTANLIALSALWFASFSAHGLNLDCEGGDAEQLVRFGAAEQSIEIELEAAEGVLAEIEELDLDLRIELNGVEVQLDSEAPPRYGRGFIKVPQLPARLIISRLVPSQARGAVRVGIHCRPSEPMLQFAKWMGELRAVTKDAAPGAISAAEADLAVERLARSIQTAPNRWAAAQAAHWQAQLLLFSGQTAKAMAAFESAARTWQEVDDSARASAATVAFVEDLQRLGRAQEVWNHTADVSVAANSDYYTIRLRHAHCLANRYLARYAEAERCFESVAAAFSAMDERAEWVSVIQNHAELKHLIGDDQSAESLAVSALSRITGPDTAMLRGRIQSLRANIAESRAAFPEALALLQQAILDFRTAGWHRWEGNMYLKVASLHLELGAIAEANAAVELASQRLSLESAPARVAATMVVRAQIAEAQQQALLTRFWLALAEALYQQLKMPLELDGVRASLAALDLARGHTDAAAKRLQSSNPEVAYYRDRWTLVDAELASMAGDHARARGVLEAIDADSLPLRLRIEHALTSARNAERAEDIESAVTALERLSATVEAAAFKTTSPLLRYLLAKRLERLDGQLVATQLRQAQPTSTDSQRLRMVWPMMIRRSTLMNLSEIRPDASSQDGALDSEIAAELLLGKRKSAQATTALLDLMTRDRLASADRGYSGTAQDLGDTLAPGTVLLSHVDLGESGLLIWISNKRQYVTETAAGSALQRLTASLLSALSKPTTPIRQIDRRAAALSGALFSGAGNADLPRRLLIDRDSQLAGVPWLVLPWPVGGKALVETTTISLAPVYEPRRSNAPRNEQINVFVAANDVSAVNGQLQALPAAWVEGQRIEAIASQHRVQSRLFHPGSRTDFLASLQQPTAIHVAAHGMADPGAIGYSGLWLSDSDGQTPAFVGWTEPMMSGVRSSLIVLNACSLAQNHLTAQSSMSFALALHRAGAEDIVAALWPTSDSATAVWVPAFYAALYDAPDDVRKALAAAISALRNAPIYRHPFYWGALVHGTSRLEHTEGWQLSPTVSKLLPMQ